MHWESGTPDTWGPQGGAHFQCYLNPENFLLVGPALRQREEVEAEL